MKGRLGNGARAALAAGTALLCSVAFYRMLYFDVASDLKGHFAYVRKLLEGRPRLNFAFDFFAAIAALGRTDAASLKRGILVVLFLATALKIWAYLTVVGWESRSRARTITFSLLAMVAQPLFFMDHPWTSIGYLSPTLWYNPPTTLAYPLAVLILLETVRFEETLTVRSALRVAWLMLGSIVVKPTIIVVFAPVIAFRSLKRKFSPVLIGVVLVIPLILFYLIYLLNQTAGMEHVANVYLAPLLVWQLRTNHVLTAVAASIAFPVVYALLYFRDVLEKTVFQLTWQTFFVGFLFTVLFAERRFEHAGNFFTGADIANTLLFLACAASLASKPDDRRFRIAAGTLALHGIYGAAYAVRLALMTSGSSF